MKLASHTRRLVLGAVIAALALALIAPGLPPADTVQAQGRTGEETLALLHNTIMPIRDRLDLARRFLGVTDLPAPPTTAPPEIQVGEVVTFWADNLDRDSFQVDAEMVYKTEHVYMFVEVGQPVDRAAVQRSADQFEQVIRPRVHEVFGTEWFPGIDGDPHLYILHARDLGSWVAAYYGSSSQYPVEAVAQSNEHEMFFINLDAMDWAIGTEYYEGVLAHEFQHMVHWYIDQNEDTWLNEGLSELAVLLTGYGASDFAPDFLNDPLLQLNTWPEDGPRGLHYGAAFLFVAYFYQRYGEEATIALVRDAANGLDSVDNTLVAIGATDPATGEPVGLVDLFADWVVVNLLMDPAAADGRYAYTHPDLAYLSGRTADITVVPLLNGMPQAHTAPQWGAEYLRVPAGDAPQRYRLSFKGQPAVSLVPATAHSGSYMWWSNRADDSNSRLTRTFDLTNLSAATLEFWTWYHIEEGWDYAYVSVSTDGAAWTPLSTARTTTDNPHDNAYGPGYSGQSGGWVQESVDLTPYVGQPVQVRFEYITDDAVTQPGMIIDDVSVPELGYTEDFEDGDSGWLSEGWLRMDNTLPQYFLVQLVASGPPDATGQPATSVTRLLGWGDHPQGEWEIEVGGALGDAVLVVSGLAPVTTEGANYELVLTPVP